MKGPEMFTPVLRRKDKPVYGIYWSLKPHLIWMRFVGLELSYGDIHSWIARYLLILTAVILFSLNFATQVVGFVFLKQNIDEESGNDTTNSLNLYIENANFATNSFGIHMSILFVIPTGKWKELWASINRMESYFTMNPDSYKLIRVMAFVCFSYIILVKSGLIWLTLYFHLTTAQHSFTVAFFDAALIVTQIFPTSILLLYCLLSLSAALNFQQLVEEINEVHKSGWLETNDIMVVQLKTWRRNHALVCDFVDKIHNCYGIILLIKISYLFVAVINSSFYLLIGIVDMTSNVELIINLAFIIEHFMHLFIISGVSDKVFNEGLSMLKALRSLQLKEHSQQLQMHYLSTQVYHSLPNVMAMGFFSVSKRLFPTLIGSSLTYLIILYEFRASAKSRQSQGH